MRTRGNSDEEETAFLGANILSVNPSTDPWTVTAELSGVLVEFKIDAGADVTAISPERFKKLRHVKPMGSNRCLKGPSLQSMKIHGKFTAKLKTSTNVIEENIYVIDNLQKHLMERPAIEQLGLLLRVESIITTELEEYWMMYPKYLQV